MLVNTIMCTKTKITFKLRKSYLSNYAKETVSIYSVVFFGISDLITSFALFCLRDLKSNYMYISVIFLFISTDVYTLVTKGKINT